MEVEGDIETGRVDVERIGVLHREFTDSQHAPSGSRLIPELGLNLVPNLGQVPVGANFSCQLGEDLFVSHSQYVVGPLAIDQAE
jgi:hypothetical protein